MFVWWKGDQWREAAEARDVSAGHPPNLNSSFNTV